MRAPTVYMHAYTHASGGWRRLSPNLSMCAVIITPSRRLTLESHTSSQHPTTDWLGSFMVALFKSGFKKVTHIIFDWQHPLKVFYFYCLASLKLYSPPTSASWELGFWACATTQAPGASFQLQILFPWQCVCHRTRITLHALPWSGVCWFIPLLCLLCFSFSTVFFKLIVHAKVLIRMRTLMSPFGSLLGDIVGGFVNSR